MNVQCCRCQRIRIEGVWRGHGGVSGAISHAYCPICLFEQREDRPWIRGSAEWNVANHWLGTKAAPKAAVIKTNLEAMMENQQELMATDMAEAQPARQSSR